MADKDVMDLILPESVLATVETMREKPYLSSDWRTALDDLERMATLLLAARTELSALTTLLTTYRTALERIISSPDDPDDFNSACSYCGAYDIARAALSSARSVSTE